MERHRHFESSNAQSEYLGTLATVYNRYNSVGMEPLFFGNPIARILRPETVGQVSIDTAAHRVIIPMTKDAAKQLWLGQTGHDFDVLVDHKSEEHVRQNIEELELLLKWQGYNVHRVATEAVHYPHWKTDKRHLLSPGVECDSDGNRQLVYGNIRSSPLPPDAFTPWTYLLQDGENEITSLPSFDPKLLVFNYLVRAPLGRHGGRRAGGTETLRTLNKLRGKAVDAAGTDHRDEYAWRDFIGAMYSPDCQDFITRTHMAAADALWRDVAFLTNIIGHFKSVGKNAQ